MRSGMERKINWRSASSLENLDGFRGDSRRKGVRGGLPIRQLHKVEDDVSARLAAEISVDTLAGLVELSTFGTLAKPFRSFSRVF
jgi:hypothetical protein